jgi:hypothetical protein
MTTVVEIGATEGFILDSPTAGVLDTSELGGTVFRDITSALIELQVTRGKNRDLDRYSAGEITVILNNENRHFDPLFTGSPYFGDIVPRRDVRLTVDGVRQFTGVIDDWNLAYDPSGQSKAALVASDDFTLLARQQLTPGTATPEASGARVTSVLDMESVNWTKARDIDTGTSTLGADVFDGNALDYLNKVATSEQGDIFVGKTGELRFRGRLDATPTSGSLITFADDGTGVPYTRVSVNYGTELLFNTAEVVSNAGTATAINQTSRTQYGVTSTELETLVSTVDQLQNLADFTVAKYKDPEYRVDAIGMNVDTLSTAHRATVLGLELGDVILLKFTPNGIGDPIEQYGQVIRLDSEITNDRHDVTIGLTSLDWTFLVLDDAVFGILDTDHLAF